MDKHDTYECEYNLDESKDKELKCEKKGKSYSRKGITEFWRFDMPKEKDETKGFVWTEKAVKDLEEFIEHLADKYLTFKRGEAETKLKSFEAMTKHNRNMVISLVLFLVAIVLGMGYLTLNGYVTGDALLFLVGTITGYVLIFIQRLVFTSRQVPSEEEL